MSGRGKRRALLEQVRIACGSAWAATLTVDECAGRRRPERHALLREDEVRGEARKIPATGGHRELRADEELLVQQIARAVRTRTRSGAATAVWRRGEGWRLVGELAAVSASRPG